MVAKWLEAGDEPRDLYDLAGLARLHPAAKEVLAALERLTAELNQHRSHWRKEIRDKAERMLALAQQGQQIFSQTAARAAYDEHLFAQIAAAFQTAFTATRQHEEVRRWLRLTQNVHATKVEEVLRRLASAEDKAVAAPPPATQPQPAVPARAPAVASPSAIAPNERNVRSPVRPPPRPRESLAPDHFGLLWIVGTAVATAIVFVLILFFFFGDRFAAKRQQAQAKGQQEGTSDQNSGTGKEDGKKVATASKNQDSDPSTKESESISPEGKPAKIQGDPQKTVPTKEKKSQGPQKSPAANPVPDPNAPPPPTKTTPQKTPAENPPPSTNPPAAPNTPPTQPPMALPPAGNAARQMVRQGQPVHTLAWNAAGDRLAVAGDGDTVRIWDVTKNAEAKVLKEAFPSCSSLAFGKGKLAAATGQGTVYVWNAATWKLDASLRHSDMQDAKAVTWGGTGDSQVIVGDGDGNLRFLSVTRGNQSGVIEFAKTAGGVRSLLDTGKSRPLWITGHLDGTVLIWSSAGKNVLSCLASSSASVLDALILPNAGASKSAQLTPHGRDVCYDLAVSPDEKLLAVAAQDVDLWELDGKNYLIRRRFVNGAKNDTGYRSAAFSTDSKLLAVGAGDGTLVIIDLAAWTAIYQEKFGGPVHCIAWRPGATRQLAVGSEDGNAVIITLAKEVSTSSVPSPLDPKQVLTEAQQNVADGDWETLAQRISYLSIYRLPSTEKNTLERLRIDARKGARELVSSIQAKSVSPDELEEAVSTLQQAIDLDPAGEGGKAAREALRQLPPLTIAMVKTPAPGKSGPNQPGSNPAAGRFGPAGRRAGAAMPGGPAKPGKKKP